MGIIEIEKNLISDIVEGRSFLSKSKQSNGILSKLGNLIPGITSKAEEKNTSISSSQKSSSTYTTSSSSLSDLMKMSYKEIYASVSYTHLDVYKRQHLGLEPRDILFQQNLYNSRLAEYNAKMAVAQSNMRQAEASLASARSGYVKLIDMYNIAKEKEERVEKLATENAISTFIDVYKRQI